MRNKWEEYNNNKYNNKKNRTESPSNDKNV